MSTYNRTTLFDPSPADVALTTDDCYTPRWVFDAAGLMFDMDVAAPVDPQYRTCPAREYLTVIEDGLTASWHGVIWCNPPYSAAGAWVARWAAHDRGMLLVPAANSRWLGDVVAAADALTLVSVDFFRLDGGRSRIGWAALVLASRGEPCGGAVRRVATADVFLARGAVIARTMTKE